MRVKPAFGETITFPPQLDPASANPGPGESQRGRLREISSLCDRIRDPLAHGEALRMVQKIRRIVLTFVAKQLIPDSQFS